MPTRSKSKNLLRLFCASAVLSAMLPAVKQAYVLIYELRYPDYYMSKSMLLTQETRGRIVASLSSLTAGEIVLCSRTGYDASLYLLAEIIRSGVYEGKHVRFPRASECSRGSQYEREGAVIFFGGRQPVQLRMENYSKSKDQ